MKIKTLSLLMKALIVFALVISIANCKKDSDDPNPNPVKNDSIAWVVGDIDTVTGYGMILRTDDGGINWKLQGVGEAVFQNVSVNNLYVLDENNIWVVCYDNRIAKTTDGGNSWTQIIIPSVIPGNGIQCISIVESSNIWISGGNGYVANSKDGGNTWTMYDKTIFNSILCQGICAITSQIVYVVGNDGGKSDIGVLRRTLDGGTSWENIELDGNYDATTGWIGVTGTDINHILVYAGKGRYAYTVNGGTTWINDSMIIQGGGGPADINHLIMLDQETWWAALDLDHIIFTNNSGSNWAKQPSAGASNQFLIGIDAYDASLALITGESASLPWGKILRTTDGGNTWTSILEGSTRLSKVMFVPK